MSGGEGLSIKRLTKEMTNMLNKPSYEYYAEPIKDEIFEWHFTIRGPPGTDYEGGIYHGIITFPETYPFKPPSVQFLTPNGRFEVNTKICLTFTNFHPEFWQPAWTIRTILIGLISYMPVEEDAMSIGAMMMNSNERK
jgi:ubiquitin-conjugating enzyme E2 J1